MNMILTYKPVKLDFVNFEHYSKKESPISKACKPKSCACIPFNFGDCVNTSTKSPKSPKLIVCYQILIQLDPSIIVSQNCP